MTQPARSDLPPLGAVTTVVAVRGGKTLQETGTFAGYVLDIHGVVQSVTLAGRETGDLCTIPYDAVLAVKWTPVVG